MFFSKLTLGFYNPAIHGDNIPADAVEITTEEYASLLDAQMIGRIIQADKNGNPIAVDPPKPTLSELKLTKIADIKSACGAAIIVGISHSALGTAYSYPATRDDQANLNGLVTESLLPDSGDVYKFWCADSSGIWKRRIHTKSQIQELGKAVAEHVKTQQEKYEQKLGEIAVADEISLALIGW